MKRPPLKVSGLIQAGKINPDPAVAHRDDFGAASEREIPSPTVESKPQVPISTPTTSHSDTTSLSSPTTFIDSPVKKISINLIDDSPYQTRLSYDSDAITNLAESLRAAGQEELIKVRRKHGDRYELISGHRRTRAARLLGWPEIDALIVDLNDREANLATMIANAGRADNSDYECALMYQKTLDAGFAKTQKEVSLIHSVSQAQVSKCLNVLSLPEPFLGFIASTNDLIGVRCASVIFDLIERYPGHGDLILKGLHRIKDGAEQNSLKAWVEQMIRQQAYLPQQKAIVTNNAGIPIFTAKKQGREITVQLKDKNMDLVSVEEALMVVLRSMANGKQDD